MKRFLDKIQDEKNINNRELAKIIGCSETLLTLIKNNQRKLSYNYLKNLLEYITDKDQKKECIKNWVDSNDAFDLINLMISEKAINEIKEIITEKIYENVNN